MRIEPETFVPIQGAGRQTIFFKNFKIFAYMGCVATCTTKCHIVLAVVLLGLLPVVLPVQLGAVVLYLGCYLWYHLYH